MDDATLHLGIARGSHVCNHTSKTLSYNYSYMLKILEMGVIAHPFYMAYAVTLRA